MDSFGTFLYQSGISIAVFYLFYWALLRKETWFSLNRTLLFGSLLLAITIPFVRITLHTSPQPGTVYYALDRYLVDGVIVHPSTLAGSAGIQLSAGKVLWGIYMLGVLFFLARFLVQIGQVLSLVRKYGIRDFEGYRIVPMDKEIAPFSFFTLIFINTEHLKGEELRSVLLHEWEHVRRLHTLDIILLELVCILQWFNPFVWLYKYSLHELHEYEADQAVLRHGGNRLNYQRLILSQAFGHNFFPVVHNLINRSFIKKRILMITKQRSGNITLIKSFLLLPVAALLVVSFSFTRAPENLQQVKKAFSATTGNTPIAPQTQVPDTTEELILEDIPQAQPQDTNEAIFFIVEDMPKFQGGDISKFREWVAQQIKYPAEAEKEGIHGKVYVRFVVKSDGSVDKVEVVRGVDPLLDAEAERVISASPKWTPGKQRGKNVAVAFTIPIVFLKGDETDSTANAPASKGGETFFIVEKMPKFQGGDVDKFKDWVAQQLRYPEQAAEKGASGRVIVSFIVGTDGSVSQVKVIQSPYLSMRNKPGGASPSTMQAFAALDSEAVRVVRSSPKWEPGMQRGYRVRVQHTIPIVFVLDHPMPAREKLKNAEGKNVVYVVDGKVLSEEEIKKIDAARIARVNVSTDKADIEKYGPGSDGVIFITTYKKTDDSKTPAKPAGK